MSDDTPDCYTIRLIGGPQDGHEERRRLPPGWRESVEQRTWLVCGVRHRGSRPDAPVPILGHYLLDTDAVGGVLRARWHPGRSAP